MSVELAGWWRRVGAVLLDALIVGVPLTLLGLAAGLGQAGQNLLGLVVGLAYSVYFIGSRGQTLGKMAAGVKIVRDGSPAPIGYGLATGRYFAAFLSALPCFLGYFWPLWDDKNQTFHDKIVSTVSIRA